MIVTIIAVYIFIFSSFDLCSVRISKMPQMEIHQNRIIIAAITFILIIKNIQVFGINERCRELYFPNMRIIPK